MRREQAWAVTRSRRARRPAFHREPPPEYRVPVARAPATRRMWQGLRAMLADWQAARCTRMAAALSFYAAFSLAPTLLLLLVLGSVFVDPAKLSQLIVGETGAFVGEQVAGLVSEVLRESERPGKGISAVFALALVVFGATTAMAELKDALDQIFSPGLDGATGLRGAVRARTRAFLLILTLTALLVLSLVANTFLASATPLVVNYFGWNAALVARTASTVATLAGAFLLCLVAFRALPALKLPWGALIYGATLATVLFVAGCALVVLYASDSPSVRAFGPAGSLAIVLLWLYYSTLAFCVGAIAARRRAIGRGALQPVVP